MQKLPAWSYAFRWDGIERAVLSLRMGRDTYRIISDPRVLKDEIIATVHIEATRLSGGTETVL